MAKGTMPNNESSTTSSSNVFQQKQQQQQQQQQQPLASSSSPDNNTSFVSVINNGYTAASREFERIFSSWGFTKRRSPTQAINVEPTQNKYHGKRKRDSSDSNDSNDSNDNKKLNDHNGPAVYARIIPDENQLYHLSSSAPNKNDNTNKPLTTFSPAQTLELPTTDSLSKNTHQHRHTFQYLVERQHSPATQSKVALSMGTKQQNSSENKVLRHTTTRLLNEKDITMGTPSLLRSESTLNTTTNPTTRRRTMEPLYVPSAIDTVKYVDLDLLEEERLAKLERIIQEAHSNATQLLSISQNSKSPRTVRFSPIVKHASIVSPRSPSNTTPVSTSSYLSPHYSSPPPVSTRSKQLMSSDKSCLSPRRLTTAASSPPKIQTEPTGSTSSSLTRFARDPFTSTTTGAAWESIPKEDDKDDIYYSTDMIPLKIDLPSSRLTSLEPFSTSSTEMKSASPSPLPHIHQRLTTLIPTSVDPPFDQQQREHGKPLYDHESLSTEQSPRKESKAVDFNKAHKKTMGIIIHQIPTVKLRRTDTIRGPDGQLKPNPIWNEIYNNGKNRSRPL